MRGLTTFVLAASASAASGQVILGPIEYFEANDTPFLGYEDLFIEDFRDMSLDSRISVSRGVILEAGLSVDSADNDDGIIDNNGNIGASYYSNSGSDGIRFEFDADAIGAAPTAVGVVWTDGAGVTTFEAYDVHGNLLGTVSASHADTGAFGQTAEDRFYGIEFEGGVGSIVISNSIGGIEVDHVQFAFIPAPSTAALAGIGGLVALRRRR